MTRDEFEALAKKAGLAKHGLGWTAWESQLERFAELVAAHEREALLRQALEALESAIPWIVTDRNTFAEVVRARHFQREDTETDESILSGYDAVIDDAEKATTALRAALAEQPAGPDAEPAIPPGYKLVPVEPTPAMLVAINWPNDPAGYRAMLAAAPEAPQPAKPAEQEPVASNPPKTLSCCIGQRSRSL